MFVVRFLFFVFLSRKYCITQPRDVCILNVCLAFAIIHLAGLNGRRQPGKMNADRRLIVADLTEAVFMQRDLCSQRIGQKGAETLLHKHTSARTHAHTPILFIALRLCLLPFLQYISSLFCAQSRRPPSRCPPSPTLPLAADWPAERGGPAAPPPRCAPPPPELPEESTSHIRESQLYNVRDYRTSGRNRRTSVYRGRISHLEKR